jgi:ATP-binding cassette subfamily B protein
VRQLVAQGTRTLLVLGFSGLIGFACMLHQSPSLALLILPPLPLVFGVAWWLSGRLRAESLAVQEGFSELSGRVQENLGGIRTIQALTQEDAEIRRFEAANDRYVQRNLALVRTSSRLAAWMPGLGALCTITILMAGGRRVQTGEITLGAFTAFLWYLGMLLWPVREAGNLVNLFQRGFAGCDRLFELLDAVPEIADPPAPDAPAALTGAIELCRVSCRYPGAIRPALDEVSLAIPAGEMVGILGRVGAGKSTLLRLLVRLLEPSAGEIAVDGFALGRLPLALLRSQVALVPQEAFLFSESVRENVAYDDVARAPAEVRAAAEAADLWDTLRAKGSRDLGGGARCHALGRPEAAGDARALLRARHTRAAARRFLLEPGRGNRGARAQTPARAAPRPHHAARLAPRLGRARGRPHRRAGSRPRARIGDP